MCLILFAFRIHPEFPLAVAANRDEFYARPTRPSAFWPECPDLLAGKDLQAGGTWLGITRGGRFAAVTNVRDGRVPRDPAHASRGALPLAFLQGETPPRQFLAELPARGRGYGGFNLVLGEAGQLWFYSNRDGMPPRQLPPGLYGLSNATLDSPWPKVSRGKAALAAAMTAPEAESLERLLRDDRQAPDGALPDTHIDPDWERQLSPCFIRTPAYGTRASTVLLQDRRGQVEWVEQNYDGAGPLARNRYRFTLGS